MFKSKDRVGELLIQSGIITKAALKAALALQAEEAGGRTLSDILIDMGVCNGEDVGHILQVQKHLRNGSMKNITKDTYTQADNIYELGDVAHSLAKKIG